MENKLFPSFSKGLFNTYYVPGLVLETWDTSADKTDQDPVLVEPTFYILCFHHMEECGVL